ncbi:MAG TPA: flagellar export protein FliJ [Rhodocyclaceae bacterium]
MSRPFPLQTVLDLMQNRTDEAARELGRRLSAEQDARKQLNLLEEYRNEYARRFQSASQQGISPTQWSNYRDFLGRLDDAIAQQTRTVERSVTHTVAGQEAFIEQRGKLKAFDTLAQRHERVERRRSDRAEQKQTDENAAHKDQSRQE